MKLELDKTEVEAILQVLGELPVRTNAWVLYQKIMSQYKEQLPPAPETEQ